MSPFDVTLTTPTHPGLSWSDSFEGLDEEDIEKLTIILRGALAATSAELTYRRTPGWDDIFEYYKIQLGKAAEQINGQGLTKTHEGHLSHLHSLQSSVAQGSAQERKESQPSKAGRQYLWLILNVIGWPYVLLILCALGKNRVERINEDHRVKLLRYMTYYRELLFCPELEARAAQFRSQEKHTKVDLPLTRGSKKRKGQESTEGAIYSEAKALRSVNFAGVTNERAMSEDFSLSAFGRSITDPVICLKTQSEPQKQVAALPQPTERFHDLPHNINLSLPIESIGAAGLCPSICKDGKHNRDDEFRTKPATNLSTTNTQSTNLSDTNTLHIIRNYSTSDVAHRDGKVNDKDRHIEPALNPQHPPAIFANNPDESKGALYFDRQLPPPVINPMTAPTNGVSGPEERSMEAASILQVEPESRDAQTLLKLLCFLDGTSISEIMLIRAKEPQKVWSPSGEIQEVPVTEVGLNSDVLSLILDDDKINGAIKRLEAAGLTTSEPGAYSLRTLHIDSAIQSCQAQFFPDAPTWRLQAMILVCHTFPMNSYVEPLYGPLGRLQINQVQYVTNQYPWLGILLSSRIKHKVAEVLLAASYFLDVPWKIKALDAVKAIMVDEPVDYLQIWSELRLSNLAGLEIGNEINESAIQSVARGQIDVRSNALRGQLILSHAADKIRWNKLHHARSMLYQFSPMNSDCPSAMERLVLKKMEVTIGRIDRYQGNFQRAKERLTPSHDDAKVDGVAGRSRISHLACVLCELNQASTAQMMLSDEIKSMEDLGLQNISSGRSLRLSLAEALLLQGSLQEAEVIYLELKEVVEDCPNPNFVVGIEKLRLWMGWARVSHLKYSWSDALTKWEKALRASEDCNWKAGFQEMVVHYSIGHVKSMLGERENSESHIKKADELYKREGRQFWLTGLGTHWLDFIWRSLGHRPEIL